MACIHKFYKDLYLSGVDYEPDTIIVGVFSPQWPEENTADWFYGRREENCFWDILPRMYGQPSLIDAPSAAWRQFCRDNRIVLTDMIACIDDADPEDANHRKMIGGFSDKALVYNFDDFDFVNIVRLLQQHQGIRNVYLTRGVTEAFWKHLWAPVMRYCNQNGLRERILLTPDSSASYQHSAYNTDNPENAISRMEDYVLLRWQQEWHF